MNNNRAFITENCNFFSSLFHTQYTNPAILPIHHLSLINVLQYKINSDAEDGSFMHKIIFRNI
jgi:hypothetical protein